MNSCICFRVQGIPGRHSREDIQQILCEKLSLPDTSAVQVESLALNPMRGNETVATVTFSEVPALLVGKTQYHIDLAPVAAERRGRIVLDTHFEGFTPLHSSREEECTIDIVAISGLNGHAFGSFKEKGGTRMWLRDDLPYDLPTARIFTYGYDTNPKDVSFQNLSDLAGTFRDRLRILRGKRGSMRPFVIIAHSLGGLVAQASLVKMAESTEERDQATFKSLRAILSFGVPSYGLDITSFGPIFSHTEERTLIYSLDKTNSDTLRDLSTRFQNKMKEARNVFMFHFYETRESPTAMRQGNKRVAMTGPSIQLVTPQSATQGRVQNGSEHKVFAINRTHSELVKFSGANDEEYLRTLDCLRDILDSGVSNEHPTSSMGSLSRDEKDCLQSLSFREQDWREQDQEITAHKNTCAWLREHASYRTWMAQDSGLLWILGLPGAGKSTLMKYAVRQHRDQRRNAEVTAAFFAHARGMELQRSPVGLYRSILNQILPSFPAHLGRLARMHGERTQTRGNFDQKWTWHEEELRVYLTSILSEVSHECPIAIFVDALDEMGQEKAIYLIDAFKQLLEAASTGRLKICFSCRHYPILDVDADRLCIVLERENGSDIRSMIENHSALSSIRSHDRDAIKSVVEERAKGVFQWVSLVLKQISDMRRQGLSPQTIISKVKQVPSSLRDLYKSLLLVDEETETDRLQTMKLFQWVLFSFRALSLEELRIALAIDATMTNTSLSSLSENESYYQLEDMPLRICSLSKGLVAVKERSVGKEWADEKMKTGVEIIHESVRDYLLNGGFDDLALSVHKDFTGNGCLNPLAPPPMHKSPIGDGHRQLSRSCIGYLLLQGISEALNTDLDKTRRRNGNTIEEQQQDTRHNFSLADYAHHFWIVHVIHAEMNGIHQGDLLNLFSWRKSAKLPKQLRPNAHSISTRNALQLELQADSWAWVESMAEISHFFRQTLDFWTSAAKPDLVFVFPWGRYFLSYPACLFALAGISSVVELMELVEPGILSRKDVLSLALLGRNENVIEAAIKSSNPSNVDETNYGPPPLFLAVALDRANWVNAIIKKGANVNFIRVDKLGVDEDRFTALYLAAQRADREVMDALLKAGADPWPLCTEVDEKYVCEGYYITAVHLLAREGGAHASDLISLLLRGETTDRPGKPLNTIDQRGRSVLSYAAQHGYELLIRILLDFGAERDNPADDEGMTPLEYAVQSGVACTNQLWSPDMPDPLISSPCGEILPLHEAVVANDSITVQTLLSSGVGVNATNACGSTALDEAIRRNNPRILRYLLDWKDGRGQTMLMYNLRMSTTPMTWAPSAGKCEWAIRNILHNTDYDFNTQDDDGVNVLMIAMSQQRHAIVGMLLSHERVNLALSNHCGQTALTIAEGLGPSDSSQKTRNYVAG